MGEKCYNHYICYKTQQNNIVLDLKKKKKSGPLVDRFFFLNPKQRHFGAFNYKYDDYSISLNGICTIHPL